MRWRNVIPPLALLLLLGLLAGFAWLTQHPEDPRLVRAESWSLVGPVATWFRATYAPPDDLEETGSPSAPAGAPTRAPAIDVLEPAFPTKAQEPTASSGANADGDVVWVAPGTPLRAAPRTDTRLLGAVESYVALPFVETFLAEPFPGEPRPAHWYKVFHGGRWAWIRRLEPPPGEPPLGRAPEPVRPLASMPPDPERLDYALELLGTDRSSGRVGPYLLYTDVIDPYVLQRLSAVAVQIEPIYRQRYGLDPLGEPEEAVVLFSRREDYRAFQQSWHNLEGLPAAGHAGSGLLAFFVEGRQFNELVSTLVHELVHLLNRRSLGPALPAWLEEGLAEDLTWAEIDPTGRVRPGTWGGDRIVTQERPERRGGVIHHDVVTAGLAVYRTLPRFVETLERGEARRLEELLDLDWETFVRTRRELHYLQSGLLVRFLIEDRETRPGFRRFLGETAEGEPLTPERLRATLDLSWEEIEERFTEWVRAEIAEAGA